MRRTKEDAEQTRQAILASAMDLFYEKGYSKTTFDEIAKRINLTKGAVYWYFRNKPDIVAALINENAGKILERIKSAIPQSGDIEFSDIINMHLFSNRALRESPQFYKFIFFIICQMEWSESILTKVQVGIKDVLNISRQLLFDSLKTMQDKRKIRPEVDIDAVVEILHSMHYGMMEKYLTKRLTADFDEITKIGFNMIFNNIKMEGDNNEN